MSMVSQLLFSSIHSIKQKILVPVSGNIITIRTAARKVSANTKNHNTKTKPKHRGWKVQDRTAVPAGKILATQNTCRWHPGLNVGFGKNGTLFAMEPGQVIITCEKVDLDWDHTWIQRHYSGRENSVIYKKHYNVIPKKQHNRFVLVDAI